MNDTDKRAISIIVEYLWDEKADFDMQMENGENPQNHIWLAVEHIAAMAGINTQPR